MGDNEGNARKSHQRRLFVKDGHPAWFFLHQSIHQESQRRNLRADIEAYGGRVASTDDRVDTVLVSATYDKELLRIGYGANPDKSKRGIHVERLSFVQHCIQHNQFEHRVPIIKGMGGRIGRRRAVEFTSSDDENLCEYIAMVQPHKEAGGRSGNRMYQQLVRLGEELPEGYSWARRHTFHAWRERYKKNRHIFDPKIERYAKAEGAYDKPLWKEDRRMSRRRLRIGRHSEYEDDSEEEYDDDDDDEEEEEEYEGEGEEISPQSEDGHEYGQANVVPQDGNFEDSQAQDVDLEISEIKKRKSVHLGTAPERVAKKRRSNFSASYPAKGKGREKGKEKEKEKEIAHESDQSDGDNEMANTSLFSIEELPLRKFENDEPMPSNVRRSPGRPLVDLPSRSDHQQMNLTQDTLVNTQSRTEFEPASHSNRRHSGHTSGSQPISHIKGDQDPESPPQLSLLQRATPGILRDVQDAPSNPTATKRPVSRKPEPRSKQKVSSSVVQPSDGPYRNTRGKSRSVEPIALPPSTFKAARRRKQKPQEEVLKDALNGPITETIEEEMDVEHILVTKDANMGAAVITRDPSLETDDAQTRRNLDPASTLPPAGMTYRSNKVNASDVLDRFMSSSSFRKYPGSPNQNDPALDENRRPRRSKPQLGFGSQEPRTPMNVRRTRQESTSSAGSFPLKGTRASAAKKEMQEQEKHTPYKPPEGTRAAQLGRSQ